MTATGGATEGRTGTGGGRSLFVALLFLLLVHPLFLRGPWGVGALELLVTLALVAAAHACASERRSRRVAWALAGAALTANWLHLVPGWASIGALGRALTLIFLAYVLANQVRVLVRARAVDSDLLFTSFSAYLLLGLAFAFFFSLLESFSPGAFVGAGSAPGLPDSAEAFGDLLYFSFVTLTTLGYGDIAPHGPAARALAPVEALLGQLYIAALVARLVALHLTAISGAHSGE